MSIVNLSPLSEENRRAIEAGRAYVEQLQLNPELHWPYFRPCQVKILIVADGLDFSDADFGLSTFVRTLLDMPGGYVRFAITLGHIGAVPPTAMMDGEPRIVRRITTFKFDDPGHFSKDTYDEVMLFGIAQTFPGRGTDASGAPYPSDRLSNTELQALTSFMNDGGGLFATGDHGRLGRFLCHAVPRARNMRLWQSTTADNDADEVSMNGPRRNDTNRLGSTPGSTFDDQSDATPQTIQPRLYRRRFNFFRFTFPHPLLCGKNGVIRVMPDHPHEGECVEPTETGLTLDFGAPLGPEYPNAAGGGAQPLPEVISTNTVLAGTTSSGKEPTQSQSFGGISAYDGHRANVGRVVTDATWHHFVNINLIGQISPALPPSDPKSRTFPGGGGFLATAAGRAHLEEIRNYYRNLAVWMAPPDRIVCMNSRIAWHLVWSHRVMEAVLSTPDLRVIDVTTEVFWVIGKHARDVLGRFASQCQSVRLIFDLVLERALPELIPEVDPWLPELQERAAAPDRVPWFDGTPLLDIALGAALVGLREAFPRPDEEIVARLDTGIVVDVMAKAGRVGIEQAVQSAQVHAETFSAVFERRQTD